MFTEAFGDFLIEASPIRAANAQTAGPSALAQTPARTQAQAASQVRE